MFAVGQKKWFQVIRFAALPTTGMPGTEHRNQERCTLRLSAPQQPFSPATGSMLPGASQPFFSPDWGRSPVTAFPSPTTTPACAKPIPGSKVLACYFAPCYLPPLPVRPFRSTTKPGSPRPRPLHRFWPVAKSTNNLADCASCLHSPSGLLPPSGSKRSAGFAACQARLPNPPDFLSLPAARFYR